VNALGLGLGLSFVRSSGEAPFSPLSLPSPLFWFDASDAATMFLESSGSPPGTTPAGDLQTVGAWRDKSANGRHITQAVGGNRPTRDASFSPSVLSCDASDRLFSSAFGPIAQPFTIGVVSDNQANNSAFFDNGTAGTRILAQRGAVGTTVQMFAGATLSATGVADLGSRRAFLFEYNGASSKIWMHNGTAFAQVGATGNAGTNTLGDLRIFGNTAAFLSSLETCEFFGNGAVLSTQQRADVGAYLKTKWGL
jgi:hypothetical protein